MDMKSLKNFIVLAIMPVMMRGHTHPCADLCADYIYARTTAVYTGLLGFVNFLDLLDLALYLICLGDKSVLH